MQNVQMFTPSVSLTDSANIGFLIQARDTETFTASGYNIWGEWLIDSFSPGEPRYKPLNCGRNIGNPTPVFPVRKDK